MNPDFPSGPLPGTGSAYEPYGWQPRLKFQHRYWVHALLFLLTLASTTMAGAGAYAGFEESIGLRHNSALVPELLSGLWFSVPVLLILGAHEFGHYALCRVHDVDATLPYFLPMPLFITGTLGAVIRIREAFPSKRALFDIGIAGPIAGFVMLVPILLWGVSLSQLVPVTHSENMLYFGEPLLYKAAAWLHFGSVPDGYDVSLHPMAFAAWWGMLATALNLMPFGQLDGGHVVYALVRRRNQAAAVSVATLVVAAALTTRSLSWVSMLVMMLVMAFVLGVHHPRVMDEDTPLGRSRQLLGLFALAMFVLCFTPVPIQTFFSK